jgi:hypothetical protein
MSAPPFDRACIYLRWPACPDPRVSASCRGGAASSFPRPYLRETGSKPWHRFPSRGSACTASTNAMRCDA